MLLLLACADKSDNGGDDTAAPPPLGMVLAQDGQLYAGIARVDVTPEIVETYTDLNGNNEFDGCMTDPSGTRGGCDEPYDDVNGDNHFDAVWIAGFQSKRAALGVHDPITATAVVLSMDGEYVVLLSVDAIGVLENRIRDLRDALEAEGVDRNRVVLTSTHAHTAPDTVGIWGIDEDLIPGTYAPFMDALVPNLYDAVVTAAADMVPVTPRQGVAQMRADAFLNGAPFGGTNPDPSVQGGINDIRDPIIAADHVWSLALDGAGGRVATLVSASGHPEVSGSDHSLLSGDYPAYMRDDLERRHGGLAMFLPGAVGGMQSALGTPLPLLDDDGEVVLTKGEPTWIEDTPENAWELARSWGLLVAHAADDAATDDAAWTALSVRHDEYLVPVNNLSFKLAFQANLLDTPDEYVVQDASCPGWGSENDLFGCVPAGSWILELGPNTLATVPGELFPELFYGVPDEPSMTDVAAREGDARWVQFDPDCVDVPWETCRTSTGEVDGCDCLKHHAVPYVLSDTGAPALVDLLPGTYKQPIGLANAYCGYIVPNPDFNTSVSVLTDDGDHYEETNSCSRDFAPIIQESFLRLAE